MLFCLLQSPRIYASGKILQSLLKWYRELIFLRICYLTEPLHGGHNDVTNEVTTIPLPPDTSKSGPVLALVVVNELRGLEPRSNSARFCAKDNSDGSQSGGSEGEVEHQENVNGQTEPKTFGTPSSFWLLRCFPGLLFRCFPGLLFRCFPGLLFRGFRGLLVRRFRGLLGVLPPT